MAPFVCPTCSCAYFHTHCRRCDDSGLIVVSGKLTSCPCMYNLTASARIRLANYHANKIDVNQAIAYFYEYNQQYLTHQLWDTVTAHELVDLWRMLVNQEVDLEELHAVVWL